MQKVKGNVFHPAPATPQAVARESLTWFRFVRYHWCTMVIRGLILGLILSVGINILALTFIYTKSSEVRAAEDFEQAQQRYPLLSKRILQEYPQDVLINFLDLRTKLREMVSPYGKSFGFYFEYLPTGTSIGINEKEEFYAASLFKVPVTMAYYHGKERTGDTSDPIFTIRKEHIDSEFGELWKKGEGYHVKASDAVKLALVESDNTAAKLIATQITDVDFKAVYNSLDIDLNADQQGALVSAKNYSSILKALYFSSVISKDSSEEILDFLTKTRFPDKLAAGVPQNILVAHKIGNFKDKEGHEGFRDCGIVYAYRRPYVLCMFSVGDEQLARDRMQLISKTIYDYVTRDKLKLAE